MNEQAQAEELLMELQRLRRTHSEFKSLWRILGDCCEALEQRIRTLNLVRLKTKEPPTTVDDIKKQLLDLRVCEKTAVDDSDLSPF